MPRGACRERSFSPRRYQFTARAFLRWDISGDHPLRFDGELCAKGYGHWMAPIASAMRAEARHLRSAHSIARSA
jgi:hypothetical protein